MGGGRGGGEEGRRGGGEGGRVIEGAEFRRNPTPALLLDTLLLSPLRIVPPAVGPASRTFITPLLSPHRKGTLYYSFLLLLSQGYNMLCSPCCAVGLILYSSPRCYMPRLLLRPGEATLRLATILQGTIAAALHIGISQTPCYSSNSIATYCTITLACSALQQPPIS